ncbi:MAG: hypothetical protein ABIP65_11510 [Vicinamibacterales bacterium]
MKVPSYDDLVRSIPDVHPRETFDQVTRLVPSGPPVVVRGGGSGRDGYAAWLPHATDLFACVIASSSAQAGAVMALAREFSPRIERHGDACVLLDVSGLGRLLGDAHGIAAELERTASDRGVTARISVAPTQTAARLLAMCDDGPTVVTGHVAAVLAALPLTILETLGTPGTRWPPLAIMHRWGIRRVGEFAALPADDVSSRFGQQGIALQRLALGVDARPLVPDPGVPRFIQMMELEWPLESLEPLSFVFARLLEPLSSSLERADRAGAALRLDLRLVDKSIHTRVLQLPAPIRDPRVLRTLLLLDLESHPPPAAIDIVTIEIDPAPSRIVQYSLLERAIPAPETLATLNARLSALVGEDRCGSPVPVDSHRPDAFVMHRFNPQDGVREIAGTLVPRHPGTCPLFLRRFRPPVAIRVAVERGRPVHVAIDRKGMPGGQVEQCAGPWRSSGAWWDAAGAHWDHDEWDVSTADGSVCRLHLDRVSERWFMEGVID